MITDIEARRNIAANLRRITAARGMSQRELAEATERPLMTINRLFRGECEPKISLIAAVAEKIGFSIEALLAPPPPVESARVPAPRGKKSLVSA